MGPGAAQWKPRVAPREDVWRNAARLSPYVETCQCYCNEQDDVEEEP